MPTFIRRFHFYSPFNALLIDIQKPGARVVATAARWRDTYHRTIRADARPVVILRPRGPVLVVYDVDDTEPCEGAPELPVEIEVPFRFRSGLSDADAEVLFERTSNNALRDGVRVVRGPRGTHRGGDIRTTADGRFVRRTGPRGKGEESVALRYELVINDRFEPFDAYRTLTHELAHLYCGHLGSPDKRLWPSRVGLDDASNEFEAETASWIVVSRIDPTAEMDHYLAQHLGSDGEVPPMSLSRVLTAAGLVENMARKRLPSRAQELAAKNRPSRRRPKSET